MKNTTLLALALPAMVAGGLMTLLAPEARADKNREERGGTILAFNTMAGVPRPYTGAANAIRGVPGGGLPWVVSSARGELKADGRLGVEVTGLVFDPNDPAVIERNLGNQNTVSSFRAVVSCLSTDAAGNPVYANLMTGLYPATTGLASSGGGNSRIEAHLNLPQPCIAPIVFVTNPAGAWFAASGQ